MSESETESEPFNEKYYGIALFVVAIIVMVLYSVATFGNFFFPGVVHFEILGYNVFYYEFWIMMAVWLMVMLICGLFVWLGMLLILQPLIEQKTKAREDK